MRLKRRFLFTWRNKSIKKVSAVLTVLVMLAVSAGGCKSAAAGTEKEQDAGQQKAMGRFVEETLDFSDKLSGDGNRLFCLSDGRLVITDRSYSFIMTKDNGKTWGTNGRSWRTEMAEEGTYLISMSVGADDTAAVIYQENTDPGQEEENTGALNPALLVVRPDQTQIEVKAETWQEDGYLYQVYVADNGRVFVSTRASSNLYEIKEDGSSRLFLTLEDGRPELIQFQGSLMVMDGYDYDGPVIYDMEKEEYLEDAVLDAFVEENYRDRDNGNGVFYDMYFFFGEEGVLYLAGEKGLYRHVIGGGAMEQVIDGELSSLGNPAYGLQGMAPLDDNEFIALFGDSRIVHYRYDPDIPSLPGKTMTVYSLEDNETIRQAVNLYQTDNPDVYIRFEVGLGKDSSVTREDALKSLNTRILAGNGPDMLVLDNMPVDSYIEKGLLLDILPVLDELEGEEELFDNIIEAVKTDDKVYAMPCEVQLPVMMTDKKYISGVNDLKGIADMMEELRREYPSGDLLGIASEKGILRLFSMTCVPAFTLEDGNIDREAVTEYLEQTKRIYDAQMGTGAGVDKIRADYEKMKEDYALYQGVTSFEDSDYLRKANFMNYVGGYTKLLCGIYDYPSLSSVQKVSDFKDSEWMPMKGQSGNVFCAQTLVGISAASENADFAKDFLKVCLGRENQSYLYYSLPVNKAAFEKSLLPEESQVGSSRFYCSVVTTKDDGSTVQLSIYWPEEEEVAVFRKCMEEADTVYREDDVLEEAVYEAGVAYIQGTKSLESAVSDIEKKISIYIAE